MLTLRIGIIGLIASLSWQTSIQAETPLKVLPSQWGVYHGAFPDLPEGPALGIRSNVTDLEGHLAKNLAYVMIANDWVDGANFPWDAIDEVSKMNRTPYVRMLPRSTRTQNTGIDPVYTLQSFLAGRHDAVLQEWARNAKLTGMPLMVEFAPEANGRWYPWNGSWNGAGVTNGYGDPNLADGPERFRDVYRRVVNIFNAVGATNVTWVVHVDSQPRPAEAWNKMAAYYPGDQYIDWIGISVFGAQFPWEFWDSFENIFDAAYEEFKAISATKPLAVVEFGVIEDEFDVNRKAKWLTDALKSIQDERYPRVKAISYWHESSWVPSKNNNLRIDSSPAALNAYAREIRNELFLSELDVVWPKP